MTGPDPRSEDLLSLLRRQAETYGDRTFMTFADGETMSFGMFDRQVAGFRKLLEELGVRSGDRVALMLKNSLFYPVAWLGVVTSGAAAVPVNSRLRDADAGYVLDHSGVIAAIVDEETEAVVRAATPESLRHVIHVRTGDPMAEFDADDAGGVRVHAGALANIQYTSGTTGFPKGCLLTHRYWQRMGAASVEALGLGPDDTLLTSQPHSYIDPQWQVVAALRSGAHLILLDGFHPSTFMRDVARFGVTIFYCVGVMPTLLLKQPPAAHDRNHSLRRVYCSAIPAEHHALIEERWGVPWFELFGMTETGVNLAVGDDDHDSAVGTGCIGRALWHNEAAVVDDNDRELTAGEVGELVLRGLGLMDGYHRDAEATAAFFRNGWAHTGDLASCDEAGRIYFRGRGKEMIRRGGENIAPAEIEAALALHPAVVECAVAPVPDDDLGEEIKAYIALKPDASADPASLAGHLRDRLAPFKVPRYWEFRKSLPHTPSERIAKHELEDDPREWRRNTIDLRT